LGGILFLCSALIMAFNIYKTLASGKVAEPAMPAAGLVPAE
jgi:cbb3-type cytochrome oxidase subunit 1